MALELRQQLKLSQQLVMTPQLQQAIKLLQLSRLELTEAVQQELLENPLLEEGANDFADEARRPDGGDAREGGEVVEDGGMRSSETGVEKDLLKSADWEDYLGDFSSTSKQSVQREVDLEDSPSFEARLSGKTSLEGHLEWQLRLSRCTPEETRIGEVVIGNLDSRGYLELDAAAVADAADVDESLVESTLFKIRRFDPVGVASRDVRECLLTQLDVFGWSRDPVLVGLVTDHLEDLEKRRYKPILKKYGLDMEDLKEYLDLLQQLEPMPGASFGSSEPQYVSPDVFVHKIGDDFVVLLNEDGLPRLELNTALADSLKKAAGKEKEYMVEKMRQASWLIKSLDQRRRTLYKVSEALIKRQRDFFEKGVTHLKPLILKDIAEDIGMHESTVSRITTNKYIATPHGAFELKFFFNSALELDDGTSLGSESVKALIKKLVGDEDPKKPLSDERIAEILKESLQVNIARRTVAKYRSVLDIPSSSQRREMF